MEHTRAQASSHTSLLETAASSDHNASQATVAIGTKATMKKSNKASLREKVRHHSSKTDSFGLFKPKLNL